MALFKRKKKNNFPRTPSSAINRNTYKKLLVKATSMLKGYAGGRGELEAPEYDLDEIKRACEADSYIRMSYMKYSYMLFKAGYKLDSENNKATDYIKSRFSMMGFATGKPIDILFQECGDDLIKYSNAILVKVRTKNTLPGINAKGFFKDNPVGGYFRVDPSTVSVKKDDKGNIKKYVQSINGEEIEYDLEDVVHMYLDRESGNNFGTPRMIAALEDVKLLRRTESNVATMIYRFSMPLFQWIIGLAQPGFQATDAEIEEARNEIDNMALDGTIITNEKTQIKVVGAEGNALDAYNYLKYFEQRVFSALGVSESQMGRGGAKQDADSMESQAHDTVKHIQRTMSIFTQEYIINELLLEGGFNPILNEDDKVKFSFNEINIDTLIKVENHEMAKFQSNMITYEEMRRTIGRKEEVDIEDLYEFKIKVEADKRMTESKTDGSLEITKQSGENAINLAKENAKLNKQNNDNSSQGLSPKGNGTNKSSSPNKDVENKNMPENQYGKTSVKIKEAASNVIKSKKKDKEKYQSIYRKYYQLCDNIMEKPEDIDLLLPLALDNLIAESKIYLQVASVEGIDAAMKDIRKINKDYSTYPKSSISLYQFEEEAEKAIKRLLKDIKKKIKDNPETSVRVIFESMEYRIRFLLEYNNPKIYWYSYLKTGQALNYKTAEVDFKGSEDEDKHSKFIDLNNINLDEIPPYHPFCDCSIKFVKGDK